MLRDCFRNQNFNLRPGPPGPGHTYQLCSNGFKYKTNIKISYYTKSHSFNRGIGNR